MLAVNESWRLAPFADALYACDGCWWDLRRGAPEFGGLKITQDVRAAQLYGLRQVRLRKGCDRLLFDEAGEIGWGGNSGFHAVNLALQFGASRLALVGFDYGLAGGVHWHGRHPARLNNPSAANLARWARTLDGQAPVIAGLGVEVVNCSPVSALTAFPTATLEDALA